MYTLVVHILIAGELPNLPFTQEITEEQKLSIMATYKQMDQVNMSNFVAELEEYYDRRHKIKEIFNIHLKESIDRLQSPSKLCMTKEKYSFISLGTIRSKKRSVSFSDTVDYESSNLLQTNCSRKRPSLQSNDLFGKQETAVFMTLFDDISYKRTLKTLSSKGTQATASINKCLQAKCESNANRFPSTLYSESRFSSYTMSTIPFHDNKKFDGLRYSDIYFFGRKKDTTSPQKSGMGSTGKKATGQTHTMPVNIESKTAQTKKPFGASTGTSTKTVCIKDDKGGGSCQPACPALGQSMKGEMVATVSHIKLGPKEPCPVHGSEPCQGPKCIVASSGEQQAPVKVTTMTNPRRGVFELVIRRINGAPLAKNELMLEWTPPPSRPSPCGAPCELPCTPAVCRPSKCKMIVCRSSPCKPKVCRKPCAPPCRSVPCSFCCKKSGSKPCRSCRPSKPSKPCKSCRPSRPCPPPRPGPCSPCRSCKPCRHCPPPRKIFKRPCPPCFKPCCIPSPCSRCDGCLPSGPPCKRCNPRPPSPCKPCRRCMPCPPSPCQPCVPPACAPFPPITFSPPSTCRSPCRPLCSKSSCSSPCLRPCPMGRKKARRCKSQPRIRAHRKRMSPCYNRSKCCPVVRCRSVPGPCIGCCSIPPCPPRKCCSILPCKPPRCCKSSCSTCCA